MKRAARFLVGVLVLAGLTSGCGVGTIGSSNTEVASFQLVTDRLGGLQWDRCVTSLGENRCARYPNPFECSGMKVSVQQTGDTVGRCNLAQGTVRTLRKTSEGIPFFCRVSSKRDCASCTDIYGTLVMNNCKATAFSSDDAQPAGTGACDPSAAVQVYADKLNQILGNEKLGFAYSPDLSGLTSERNQKRWKFLGSRNHSICEEYLEPEELEDDDFSGSFCEAETEDSATETECRCGRMTIAAFQAACAELSAQCEPGAWEFAMWTEQGKASRWLFSDPTKPSRNRYTLGSGTDDTGDGTDPGTDGTGDQSGDPADDGSTVDPGGDDGQSGDDGVAGDDSGDDDGSTDGDDGDDSADDDDGSSDDPGDGDADDAFDHPEDADDGDWAYPDDGDDGDEEDGDTFECRGSPLVLDLGNNGINLTSIDQGIRFNLAGSGPMNTGWVRGDDALLVLDRNGNGAIDDGRELFGERNTLEGTDKNGFEALAHLDQAHHGGDQNGRIDSGDLLFPRLQVWNDANQDGTSQPWELRTLKQVNIVSIPIDRRVDRKVIDQFGNDLSMKGSFVFDDGTLGTMIDVWFVAGFKSPPQIGR